MSESETSQYVEKKLSRLYHDDIQVCETRNPVGIAAL